MGRALAHRDFRLFAIGQGISAVGTWMQQAATVWLVYRLTDSSFLLGRPSPRRPLPTPAPCRSPPDPRAPPRHAERRLDLAHGTSDILPLSGSRTAPG
jgi:hypothetical protein